MKVKNLTYGKSWELQGYWEKVLIEVEVEENELPNTVLDKAKNIVEGWHRQRNPELYVDVIDENKKPLPEIKNEEIHPDEEWTKLVQSLTKIGNKEDALEHLAASPVWRLSKEAKQIAESLPSKK